MKLLVTTLLFASFLAAQTPAELPANQGSAAVWQSLKKLRTRASLVMITAHPDDEDGGMLTYEARGRGTRVSLLTLNRGEGGANVMSADFYDALGLVRTMELLEAGRHYGVDQYFTRLVDYGFSKTRAEALGRWTHQRALADVVRAVRTIRPLVVTSVFVGGPSDGHGNHEVAGQMAADVFQAAADPSAFPDQIRAGLRPWKPLKYYARVPRGRAALSTEIEIPAGDYDPMLGASYLQIAREGLGYQKSQNGGPSIPQPGPRNSAYHRFASHVPAPAREQSFFDGIDTSLAAISNAPALKPRLAAISAAVEDAIAKFNPLAPETIAPQLAAGLKETEAAIAAAGQDQDALHELRIKQTQFHQALVQALGVSVNANVTGNAPESPMMAMMAAFRGLPDTFRIAIPGQKFAIRLHVANQSGTQLKLVDTGIETDGWSATRQAAPTPAADLAPRTAMDLRFEVAVPANAPYTRPYFTRPDIEQPYYDIAADRLLGAPLAPWPATGWAEFEFSGVRFRASQTVQTIQRVNGLGALSEPLAVGPAISVGVSPRAGIVPLGAKSFPLTVMLRSNVKGAAQGKVRLELPAGWKSTPESIAFSTASEGADQTVRFEVFPGRTDQRKYAIAAIADYDGKQYREGYQTTGYPGLRPYFLYRPAAHRTSGVDVKIAPGLSVGYIAGSGDEMPEALGNLGVKVSFLSSVDLATGDLSKYNVILMGVRAYAAREDVKTYNSRILEYVKNGGVVIVQYNTPEYDKNYGPYPYVMGNNPEEVTDEESKVGILDPANPIFTTPNRITAADFQGWVEERGSKWMKSWDPQWTPLLSTQDAAQEPQKGGLLFARYGKGIYVYNAWAFYRQLPEGVPGAYRIFANMLSLGAKK